MYPCNLAPAQTPALYTYYAFMSLVVVVLAISLIWIPFVQLVTEVITVVIKVMLYANAELLGNKDCTYIRGFEEFCHSQFALVTISICCLAYMLYLASGDFLLFARSYVCNLPSSGFMDKLKAFVLGIINFLLEFTGKNKDLISNGNIQIQYHKAHGRYRSPSTASDESQFN